MVWPRQRIAPSAPIFTILSKPPPSRASPVRMAAWSFVIPAVSAIFS